MERKTGWLCGVVGLVIDVALLALSMLVHRIVPAPAADVPLLVTIIFLLFLSLALVEIPLMIFALRSLAGRLGHRNPLIFYAWITLYVAFPAVYAGLSLVLTGWLAGAAVIAATGVIRLGSLAVLL